ncbi:MAG: site-specific integrase [Xanthobacteraceae bacterium]
MWTTLGATDHILIADARKQASNVIARVRRGLTGIEPAPPKPESFQAVAENWLKRRVQAKGLRSGTKIQQTLQRHVFPVWGEREFTSIRRGDVARLLDHIEDNHGGRIADLVLSYVRSICNCFAARTEDYSSPLVPGMRRHGLQKRERVLTDDELRRVWRASEAHPGAFGGLVRVLLLTAQRAAKVASMRWDDVGPDGVWNIRTQAREKGNAGALPLPSIALEIIRSQRRIARNPYVFVGIGNGHCSPRSQAKLAIDKTSGVTGWVLHDLRRTARSLMSRAGVSSEHAERVLGHAIKGVEGVYDRHRYEAEKGRALEALAGLITRIIDGNADVVPFRREA